MKNIYYLLALLLSISFIGCSNHPKDETNFDDIIHCGFGQEYVSGYKKSNGTKVDGYCRESNSKSSLIKRIFKNSDEEEGFYEPYTNRYYKDSNEYEQYNNPDYGQ